MEETQTKTPSTLEHEQRLSLNLQGSINESDTMTATTSSLNVGAIATTLLTVEDEQRCQSGKCLWNIPEFFNLSDFSGNIYSKIEGRDEILHNILQVMGEQFQIRRHDGSTQETSINNFNLYFINEHYPNISKEIYSYPLVNQPKNTHESTSSMEKKNFDRKVKSKKYYQRRSDEAAQETVRKLLLMFERFKIPSFTITSYRWEQFLYPKLVTLLKEELSKYIPEDGESDILVLLPGKGVLLIEVKSQAMEPPAKNIKAALKDCLRQCTASLRYVSCSTLDLTVEKNFWYVKVASFPNCSKTYIETMICDKCSKHFITKGELESLDKLHLWFEKLFHRLKDRFCDFDAEVVASMVARFIGPMSKVVVKNIKEQIEATCQDIDIYGSFEKIKSNWVMLNEEQANVTFRNPRYLWITGDPGTGKTVLALWKVQQILKRRTTKEHVIYLIAGNRDMLLIKDMKMLFNSKQAENSNNVRLMINSIESICPEKSNWYDLKGLLYVIQTLTSRHPESFVSIIVDEFWLVTNNKLDLQMDEREEINLKLKNLKHLWIIQNPSCQITPQLSNLELGFQNVNLKSVMRMSAPTVKFIKQWLNNTIMGGHASEGLLPELYTMECICEELHAEDKSTCIPFLIKRLTEEVLSNLKSPQNKDVDIDISKDVVVMTNMNVKVKKLLSQKQLDVTVRPAVYFTGCEKKVVIVDIRDGGGSGNYERYLTEALTRAKGLLVLLDVSCKNAKEETRYLQMDKIKDDTFEGYLKKLYDTSQTDIRRREPVKLNQIEINLLQREIYLGLYRDEQEINENMGSAVTVKLLQKTIAPLEKNIEKLQDDVSKIGGDISAIKQILQNGHFK